MIGDPAIASAWSVRAFRIFLVARTISWAGNAITVVALPLLVYQLSESPALTGLVAAGEAVPYLLFGLLAGALADRWDRKRAMVVTGGLSGIVMAAVPVLHLAGVLAPWHVILAGVAVSTLFVFFDAAGFGALPEMVGRPRLASANGVMVAVSTVVGIVGPAVGGVLVASLGAAWAIGIDAIAYVVAAVVTACVVWARAPRSSAPLRPRRLVPEIAEGLRFIRDTPVVRILTVVGAGASLSGGAMLGLLVVVGVERLGMSSDGAELGLLYAATALGAFLVSLVMARIQRRVATGRISIGALAVSWAAQVSWAVVGSTPLALMVLVVFQMAATLLIMNGIIVRQSLAPDALQSRVNTTARMIAWGGTPLGALLGGLLAERLPLTAAILICSIGTLLGLLGAFRARLWRVPRLAVLVEESHQGP